MDLRAAGPIPARTLLATGPVAFLVALDLPCTHPDALRVAGLLARATGEVPLVIHVSGAPSPLADLADLYVLSAPLRAGGARVRIRTVEGDATEGICRCAAVTPCRWILLGTHRDPDEPPGLARSVMRCSPLPVAAVRPAPCDPPSARAREVILASNGEPTGGAPRVFAGLLAEGAGVPLQEVPEPRLRTRTGGSPGRIVVVPVDPDGPEPAWILDLLRWDPGTVVAVSRRPLARDVCYPTGSG